MQQQLPAPEDVRPVALRVLARQLHVAARRPVTRRERLDRETSRPGDEEPRVRVRARTNAPRVRNAELEPVRLRLVAAEDQDGPVRGTVGAGREELDVDGVREDLPACRRLAEEAGRSKSFQNSLW